MCRTLELQQIPGASLLEPQPGTLPLDPTLYSLPLQCHNVLLVHLDCLPPNIGNLYTLCTAGEEAAILLLCVTSHICMGPIKRSLTYLVNSVQDYRGNF